MTCSNDLTQYILRSFEIFPKADAFDYERDYSDDDSNQPYFGDGQMKTPEIEGELNFHDEFLYGSNLFMVSIEIDEFRDESAEPHHKFVKEHDVYIARPFHRFSSKSSLDSDVYEPGYQLTSDGEEALELELKCKFTFKFVGTFATTFDGAVEKLKNLASKPFGYLLKDDLFSDFTIVVGEKSFKVHKCVLANASDVLKTMLTCGLDETKINTTVIACKPEMFEHFLKFIYEGFFGSNTLAVMATNLACCDLYELAHRYDMKILVEMCTRYVLQLKKFQIEKDPMKVYAFAETYGINQLRDVTWEIVKKFVLNLWKCY